MRKHTTAGACRRTSRGVVLIVALFLLIVLSLATVASIRATGSMELSTNNARSQALAMQAAEAALRYCEKGAVNAMTSVPDPAPKIPVELAPDREDGYYWQSLRNWDRSNASGSPTLTVLGTALVSNTDTFYKRPPECMAQLQYLSVPNKRAVITARGFGPEVAVRADNGAAPVGAEVWLQSVIQLD